MSAPRAGWTATASARSRSRSGAAWPVRRSPPTASTGTATTVITSATTSPPPSSSPAGPAPAAARATRSSSRSSRPASPMAASPARWGPSRPVSPSGSAWSCATTRATPKAPRSAPPTATATFRFRRGPNAGAAFLEVQFYPPGRSGFGSCDLTHWCAALTIDSLQAQFGALHGPGNIPGAISNPNCAEPVNFAYLTKSGKPIGPPGPDTQKNQSFKPTNAVLRMNQGDVITVNIHDTAAGLSAAVTDHSTGGSGSMVASVANGFRHILFDPVHLTCNGAPYAFHPMYNTA